MNAGRAVEAEAAGLARRARHPVDVAEIRDAAQQAERGEARGFRGEMHDELRHPQHLGRGLRTHCGCEVLASGHQREQSSTRRRDFSRIEHRARIFQHGDQDGTFPGALDATQMRVDRCEIGGAADLGHEQPEGAGPACRLRIVERKLAGIDPHEHFRAVAADGRHGISESRACGELLMRGDGILEIEDQRVGAALMRMSEEFLGARRHIEQRADHAAAPCRRSAAIASAS